MIDNDQLLCEIYSGLKALAESSFPKKCANCGRLFESVTQFVLETQVTNNSTSGLKQSEDDDGSKIVEVFRNCPCGSTLMDFFGDRRDFSKAGAKRREQFDRLLNLLSKNGIKKEIARTELIKLMRGGKSEILSNIGTLTK